MEKVRVSDAQRGMNASIQTHESYEADGVFSRSIRPCGFPLDLLEVGRDERDVAGRTEIEEGGAGQQGRVQPERLVRDQVIDARRTEEIATGGSASDAARGEHEMSQQTRPI
jgi:hypothetical protein